MKLARGDEWLDAAHQVAEGWTTATLQHVANACPYPDGYGVRLIDWCELVAHVSTTKGEDPITTAHRLAQYVTAYRETHKQTLALKAVRDSQEENHA